MAAIALDERRLVFLLVAAAAIFYLAPWAPVYLLALAAVAALSWYRLDIALTLVVLFSPLFMLPKHIGGKEFAPSEIFIVLDVVIAVAYTLDAGKCTRLAWRQLTRSPFLVPAVLFLLAATVSALAAADRHQAFQAYRERILEPIAFFALLALLGSTVERWTHYFGSLIAAGLYVAVLGIGQRITHQHVTIDAGIEKITSVYGSPDNVGLLFDRVFPMWLATGLLSRFDRRRRLLWSLAGLTLLVALALTYSRGAWAAVAISAIGLVAILRHWGRYFAIFGALVLIGVIIVSGPSLRRAFSAGHAGTVQRRFLIWHSAARMIEAHPILGIGPDNFIHYYAPKPPALYLPCQTGLGYVDPAALKEPCESHPHDEILDFWLSTGIVGLLAFVWLEAIFWSILWRSYPLVAGQRRVWLIGSGAAMLASLIHGLVDNSYFLPDLSLLFWLLCAFASFLAVSLQFSPSVRFSPSPSAEGEGGGG